MVVQRLCLLLVLAAGIAFVVVSFDARVRLADPNPIQESDAYRDYHCYYDRVYTDKAPADVFVFGASRTFFAARPPQIERAYRAVRDEDVEVAVFAPRWPNAEIAYLFLRDYLANNPPPRQVLVELTSNLVLREPVRYIHPLFASLASIDLYADVARSWDFVASPLYALSDTLVLLIRHIDLSLNALLSRERTFLVPDGDHCKGRERLPKADPATDFTTLLAREAQAVLPAGGWDAVGDYALLAEHYRDLPLAAVRLAQFGPGWSRQATEEPWTGGAARAKSLDYYRRIVALAAEHDIELGFYVLPQLYAPEPPREALARLAGELGAPVHSMPFRYTLLTYHYYRDNTHVTDEVAALYGTWFASLLATGGD